MRFKFLILFAFTLFSFTHLVHAQMSNVPDPVQYTVGPETPGPNQLVYIEVEGVGSFIGNSTITWQQNGKVVKSGVGLTTFSFTTGGVGTPTAIHVVIQSVTNGTITHDFYFNPSIVYLTWEADTSLPLFFKGKALYTAGSRLSVVALPFVVSGKSVLPANKLSFQWSRDKNLLPAQSGTGRNVFTFDGDQIQPQEDVSVDVQYGGQTVGHAEISIPASTPQMILYSRDPLRGELLERALPSSFNLTTSEITLQAEPYYFANRSISQGQLSYAWTLNDEDTSGPDSARGILTLRQNGQGTGSTVVGVSAQNLNDSNLLQQAQGGVQISFGQAGNSLSSFLGL